ncbi:DUF6765 family protein [Cystobacter fuscus]
MLQDAISLATRPARRKKILAHALGNSVLAPNGNPSDTLLNRFNLILLGVRAHVIADTWAHQDFAPIDHAMNTYYGVDNGSSFGATAHIRYTDGRGTEVKELLQPLPAMVGLTPKNLEAAPSGTSYLGHAWMGHFPDFSFVKWKYRPAWRMASDPAIERDNPAQYKNAFLELCSLFKKAQSGTLDPNDSNVKVALAAAATAISSGCDLSKIKNGRKHSEEQWLAYLKDVQYGSDRLGVPQDIIDCDKEPDQPAAVLSGCFGTPSFPLSLSRYGTFTVGVTSDLYLFQIAVDYHFQFVKNYLKTHDIMTFKSSWSQQDGPLASSGIEELFKE